MPLGVFLRIPNDIEVCMKLEENYVEQFRRSGHGYNTESHTFKTKTDIFNYTTNQPPKLRRLHRPTQVVGGG